MTNAQAEELRNAARDAYLKGLRVQESVRGSAEVIHPSLKVLREEMLFWDQQLGQAPEPKGNTFSFSPCGLSAPAYEERVKKVLPAGARVGSERLYPGHVQLYVSGVKFEHLCILDHVLDPAFVPMTDRVRVVAKVDF